MQFTVLQSGSRSVLEPYSIAAVINDNAAIRNRLVQRHDELERPLYEAALAGDVEAIRRLSPAICRTSAQNMIRIARVFRPIQTGMIERAFHTVVFDARSGLWRRQQLFVGPVPSRHCAVCCRPAVYQLRDTHFCRSHSLKDLAPAPLRLRAELTLANA